MDINILFQVAPVCGVLGVAVTVLWRKLSERDDKLEKIVNDYHAAIKDHTLAIQKVLDKLG